MIDIKRAFTLVELVVVLTILTILTTVGFVGYLSHLESARDSNRTQQMTGIYKGLTLYGTRVRLPIPGDPIQVVSGSTKVGLQGYADQKVLDAIKYAEGGEDPKTKTFFTYFVSADRKYSQILGFFEELGEDNIINPQGILTDGVDYSILNPEVVGAELGVLIQETTQIPIQAITDIIAAEELDILTATGSYASYANNVDITLGTGIDLIGMIPGTTCKKVLESYGSASNGVYRINLIGSEQIEVYCDMETDGGGWTFIGHIDDRANSDNISFTSSTGDYETDRSDTNSTYLLDMDSFNHTEMLWLFEDDASAANINNNLVQIRYDTLTPGFYTSALTPCNDFFVDTTPISYRMNLSDSFTETSNMTYCTSSSWGFEDISTGLSVVELTNTLNGDGNGQGVYYDKQVWGINPIDPEYDEGWGNDAWLYVR